MSSFVVVSRKRRYVLFALLCAGHISACDLPGAAAQQSDPALAQARSALAAGDLTQAARILSNHVQAHPHDDSARLLLAETYNAEGQIRAAEEQFETILQFAPENYMALAGLGELYDRAGNPEKAEPLLAHAVKASRGASKMRIKTAWATVLARLHRFDDASQALTGVTPPAAGDESLSFHRLKASVAAGLGDGEMAASEMEKALELAPENPGLQMATAAAELQAKHWKRAASLSGRLFTSTRDPRLGLILLQAQLGGGEEIRSTLEALHAVTLDPQEEVRFRQQLADLLVSHDRLSEAAEELRRAAELEPHRADLSFNLALAEFKCNRLDEALARAENLQKSADSAELEDLLGDIQEAKGDNLSAVHSYQAAVRLAPDEEKYRLSLALELVRHKSFEPARLVLTQAQKSHPESWRVQLALGMVEFFAGTVEDATTRLLKAAGLAPDPEPALRYVGDIEMNETGPPNSAALAGICDYADRNPRAGKLGFDCAALIFRRDYVAHDPSHARDILKRLDNAAKAIPNDPSPHCQLGDAYRWIDEWQEALRESEVCARMDPGSAEAHYRLSQIYQHLGQQQRSRQEMKLYEAASSRAADENTRRDETIKTFLYSIQSQLPRP